MSADDLAGRIISSTTAMFDLYGIYLGDRLGLYRALAEHGRATSAELASRTGCTERYVREWLEHQAVTGFLTVDESADASQRRYTLPATHAEVLADIDNGNFVAPLAQLAAGAASIMPQVVEAYRSGNGVPYAGYGIDLREGQAAINRVAFLQSLPQEWLPAIPELDARLRADPPARVADLGCGAGWSCIGIAFGYPKVLVDGFDLDPASVDLAKANVAASDIADRVAVQLRDAGDPSLSGQYDLVTIFEALHDMGRPVDALRVARGMLASGGTVLVADERVAEAFAAPGDEIERLMYGWSVLHCLPAGLADEPSVGTGTVLRPAAVEAMAREAGFSRVDVLPIDNLFFRFYRLHP
jgi:SAM-dependent methyltransferase